MSKRQAKFDQVIDGVRVRIYATRSEYEAVFNDDEVDDPQAQVLCYPKMGGADTWARQARLEYRSEKTS